MGGFHGRPNIRAPALGALRILHAARRESDFEKRAVERHLGHNQERGRNASRKTRDGGELPKIEGSRGGRELNVER